MDFMEEWIIGITIIKQKNEKTLENKKAIIYNVKVKIRKKGKETQMIKADGKSLVAVRERALYFKEIKDSVVCIHNKIKNKEKYKKIAIA